MVPTNSPYCTCFSSLLSTKYLRAATSVVTTLPFIISVIIPREVIHFENSTISSPLKKQVLYQLRQLYKSQATKKKKNSNGKPHFAQTCPLLSILAFIRRLVKWQYSYSHEKKKKVSNIEKVKMLYDIENGLVNFTIQTICKTAPGLSVCLKRTNGASSDFKSSNKWRQRGAA